MNEILTLDGLCIKSVAYGESDNIITIYADKRGKLSAKVRAARSAKSKLRYAASPLTFAKYVLAVKGDKATVTACDVYDNFFSLTADMRKFYAACTVLEFLEKTQPEGEFNGALFLASLNCLRDLAYSRKEEEEVLCDFLLAALAAAGYARPAGKLRDLGNFLYKKTDVVLTSLKGFLALPDRRC